MQNIYLVQDNVGGCRGGSILTDSETGAFLAFTSILSAKEAADEADLEDYTILIFGHTGEVEL